MTVFDQSCAVLTGAMGHMFFAVNCLSRGDGYVSRRNSKEHLFVIVSRLVT